MKKLGIVFVVVGLSIIGWFGYKYWNGMQSMTKLDEDVVKDVDEDDDRVTSSTETVNTENKSKELLDTINHSDGDDIATLVMPTIDTSFEVFWGTGEDVLEKGVGMYDSDETTTPDQMGHTVLSGHRDSVFRPVGDLEDGDSIYVQYQDEDYEYEIHKTWITDAQDQSVIVDKDEPTLTLTTCYPFEFIGDAPDRYIVEAEYIREGDLLDL